MSEFFTAYRVVWDKPRTNPIRYGWSRRAKKGYEPSDWKPWKGEEQESNEVKKARRPTVEMLQRKPPRNTLFKVVAIKWGRHGGQAILECPCGAASSIGVANWQLGRGVAKQCAKCTYAARREARARSKRHPRMVRHG